MATAQLAFEIGDEVNLKRDTDFPGHTVTSKAVGTVEDITSDERFYVVFHDDEYEDMGSKVTCGSVFDAEDLRPAAKKPDCLEFDVFGTCIHSECMRTAGL